MLSVLGSALCSGCLVCILGGKVVYLTFCLLCGLAVLFVGYKPFELGFDDLTCCFSVCAILCGVGCLPLCGFSLMFVWVYERFRFDYLLIDFCWFVLLIRILVCFPCLGAFVRCFGLLVW